MSFHEVGVLVLLCLCLVCLTCCPRRTDAPAPGPPSDGPAPPRWPTGRPLPKLTITDRTAEPLLKAEKPWEDFCMNYLRVLRIGGAWHMWYHCYDHTCRNDEDSFLCYARSTDGVHWQRPSLGLVEYGGSRKNNILARRIGGSGVFVDESAPAAERFKIVFIKLVGGLWQVYGGTSPDGIHWKWIDKPLLRHNSDTDNVCFRDGGVYRLYVRMWSGGTYRGRRQVGYTESKTFGDFPPPTVILEPDEQDPKDLHFYNSAATRLMDGLYVMFPSGFYTASQVVCTHAALSRDGKTFQRVGRKPILRPGTGFDSRSIYVAPGAIPADKPGEYWFYYLGTRIPHDQNRPDKVRYAGGIGRFRLRLSKN